MTTLTIRLDDKLDSDLREFAARTGTGKSEFAREHGEVIVPVDPAPWPVNDPDDRWIVASAPAGSADLLVTGDKDLIAVGDAVGLPVVTPRGFWESLRTPAARTRPD
ncbi:MAG: hypothetical protein OXU81_05185, partial [Gammaproteobacteria bacterium]|nr:hypothetical protein [Gammaproteobacteria bacterium]